MIAQADMHASPSLAAATAAFATITDARREVVIFAYLDPEWRLLGLRHMLSAERDAATVRVRDVVADALAFDAAAVAMAHNHPSGDPTPSADDHLFTRRLSQALAAIGVRLVEHVVLATGGSASFRAQGLL